jgi:Tfp pilus assembly protein PilO
MKLRLLIIPVAILLVVIATIGILLPQTFEIIGATKNAKEAKENLADTMAKIENADKLSYELTVNVEKQNILLRYIPKNKQEETIINNLDTIASSEGVAITSLAMVAEKKNADPGEASTKKKEEKASSNKLKTVEFSVNVVGSYDQIKSFLTKTKRHDYRTDKITYRRTLHQTGYSTRKRQEKI